MKAPRPAGVRSHPASPKPVQRRPRKQAVSPKRVLFAMIAVWIAVVGGIYLYQRQPGDSALPSHESAQDGTRDQETQALTENASAESATPTKIETEAGVEAPQASKFEKSSAMADVQKAAAPAEKLNSAPKTVAVPVAAMASEASKPEAVGAPKVESDGYPGLPSFALATGVKVGDPDRARLLQAAKWAAESGKWARHLTALTDAIGNAAAQGSTLQHPRNIEALLTLPTPSLAVEHAKFIRAVTAETLSGFGGDELNRQFLTWLFERPAVLSAFTQTIQPRDKAAEALLQWRTIWTDDPPNRDALSSLAIACALVFDEPVRIAQNIFGFRKEESGSDEPTPNYNQKEATALARYHFYRDCAKKGALKVGLPAMMPWELVWVVDAPVPESELIWAQKHVNYSRRDWGKAYGHIRYRMDRATQDVNPYKAYTLSEIEKEGGICGDQAYFAAISAKANGIPAMVIGGEGDRGAHAWFGYEIGRNDWNLSTGRYADNFAAGTTRDPQTGESVKEHELRQRTDPARRTMGYDNSEKLLALSKLLIAGKKPAQATVAIQMALKASIKNYDAWSARLDDLSVAKVSPDVWLRESARARTTFKEYSDLVQELEKREVAYVSTHGEGTVARQLVHTQTARMERKDSGRTDLILDSVFQEADLAAKGGDPEGVGRIYRDALKDKGAEVVAFRRIAERYYNWGKEASKGPEAVRYIVSFFDRKHDEPHGDVFAMGAYRGLLKTLVDMAKEQNLETLQHRLEHREEKLDAEEKKLAKLQSKGADR